MNTEIKERAKTRGVKLWQIAYALGMNDGNFSRKLRRELLEDERDKILRIIAKLAEEEKYNG